MELFAKIVFGYNPLTFLYKAPSYMFDWFYKPLPINPFYVLLSKILHLEKKEGISTPVYLSLLFREKMSFIKGSRAGRGVVIKMGRWKI